MSASLQSPAAFAGVLTPSTWLAMSSHLTSARHRQAIRAGGSSSTDRLVRSRRAVRSTGFSSASRLLDTSNSMALRGVCAGLRRRQGD